METSELITTLESLCKKKDPDEIFSLIKGYKVLSDADPIAIQNCPCDAKIITESEIHQINPIVRVLMHKGFGTCDFEPSRLNVYLDKDRLIDKWFSKRQNLDIQWISRFSRITAL